jgi:hypothetical protein
LVLTSKVEGKGSGSEVSKCGLRKSSPRCSGISEFADHFHTPTYKHYILQEFIKQISASRQLQTRQPSTQPPSRHSHSSAQSILRSRLAEVDVGRERREGG